MFTLSLLICGCSPNPKSLCQKALNIENQETKAYEIYKTISKSMVILHKEEKSLGIYPTVAVNKLEDMTRNAHFTWSILADKRAKSMVPIFKLAGVKAVDFFFSFYSYKGDTLELRDYEESLLNGDVYLCSDSIYCRRAHELFYHANREGWGKEGTNIRNTFCQSLDVVFPEEKEWD